MDTPVPVTEPINVRRLDRANIWPISLQRAGGTLAEHAFVGARRGHRGRP